MYDFIKVAEKVPPLIEVEEFFNALRSLCVVKKGRPGQRFSLQQDEDRLCFILFKGTGIVKRASDSMVLSTIHGPCIIGLHDIFHVTAEVQISATDDVEYSLISTVEVLRWAEEKSQWKNLCYMLILSATRLSDYLKETVGISNYMLVCNLLNSLCNESFEIRATTTALEYIQDRSMLSRSGIMKMLSALRSGGYIVINKGLLVKINSLPKKF